jgi:SAM-dependent methyltransferase
MMGPTAAGYDAVAAQYAVEIGNELPGKPVDRAFLTILAESVGLGVVADVGCGPGHITAYLHELGVDAVGIDLSPGMVAVAQDRHPGLSFTVGSLLSLPVGDGGWAGAVCAYSIIHLTGEQRPAAFAELARALAPGGWLLLSFHVSDGDYGPGEVQRLESWWGHDVALDFHYLDPDHIAAEVTAAGFELKVAAVRAPWPGEHASQRAHMLAQRR